MNLHLTDDLGEVTVETDLGTDPKGVIIIGHGAGAGMHHPFMVKLSGELANQGLHAVRFNFPYMEQGRKSPGSPKKNIECWNQVTRYVTEQHPGLPVYLSGKSYGGRMASHLLAESQPEAVNGIIYFGFPLHAPGKDSKERADHLNRINVPQLFLQGTKDKLANIALMKEVTNELKSSTLIEIDGGDHSFNVPKSSGISKEEMIRLLVDHSIKFIKENQ